MGQREMLFDVATPDGSNGLRMYREQEFIKFEIQRNGAAQSGPSRLQYRTQFRSNTGSMVTQPQEPFNEVVIVTVILSVASNSQQMFINGQPVPIDANGNFGSLSFNTTLGQYAYPRSSRYFVFVGKQAETTLAGYALTGGEIFMYSGSFHYFSILDSYVDSIGDNNELMKLVSRSCCSVPRHGIACNPPDAQQVTDINLSSNGVVGTLPSTFFTYFKSLKTFDISSQCSQAAQCQNVVASVFSTDMQLPESLATLVLSYNNIQGSLPEDVIRGAKSALTTLDITGNGLSGKYFNFNSVRSRPTTSSRPRLQASSCPLKTTARSYATACASTITLDPSTIPSGAANLWSTLICPSTCSTAQCPTLFAPPSRRQTPRAEAFCSELLLLLLQPPEPALISTLQVRRPVHEHVSRHSAQVRQRGVGAAGFTQPRRRVCVPQVICSHALLPPCHHRCHDASQG